MHRPGPLGLGPRPVPGHMGRPKPGAMGPQGPRPHH